MFQKLQFRTRQILPGEEIPKNGRDMSFFALRIHHADGSTQKEFDSRRCAIHIWRGQDGHSAELQKASDISQEADGVLHVFDYLDRGNQGKAAGPQSGGKVRLVEIDAYKGDRGLIFRRVHVDSHHIPTSLLQTERQGATACAQIDGSLPGTEIARENLLQKELVQAGRRRRLLVRA